MEIYRNRIKTISDPDLLSNFICAVADFYIQLGLFTDLVVPKGIV